MKYCNICHKSKDEQHFIDFPEHGQARSKAARAPRGGQFIQAEQSGEAPRAETPERPKRARPPRVAEAEGGGIPAGLLAIAGLGVLGALFVGVWWDNRKRKKAQKAQQNNQSQRIEIEGNQGDQGGG